MVLGTTVCGRQSRSSRGSSGGSSSGGSSSGSGSSRGRCSGSGGGGHDSGRAGLQVGGRAGGRRAGGLERGRAGFASLHAVHASSRRAAPPARQPVTRARGSWEAGAAPLTPPPLPEVD
ncbi:hypothetical protein I4F81_005979 [Pyropia yezoensis]|uniref:Uncharacterized protein n=1 Tax=Pyropia yezoensis TaxID=2788 RepID=A0ACC3C002_PYRYE|nr:hypothetical protein I4F81_005979 [Neopyropia yezoensis]